MDDAVWQDKITLFGAERFELTAEHVALLREAGVTWWNMEWGAPAIDGKRPYGNGNYLSDIHEIVTGESIDDEDAMPAELRQRYERLHKETERALQVILSAGSFEPGSYISPKYHNVWRLDPEHV